MKRIALISVIFVAATGARGERPRSLNEVTVTARRPLSGIGAQITRLDSLALKDNAALSMADILAFNSSLFVKNHGRATLSTVSIRGTSAAHTRVSWNGLRLNSPMSGMTDFSAIPAFFMDRAEVSHGATSVALGSGGLGGSVSLSSAPETETGFHAQYSQGIGSFRAFDEFAKLSYATASWQLKTRVAFSSSPNRYPFTNHDKKVNIYDSDFNIIGQYHPRERNRSGAYADLHLMQEAYFTSTSGARIQLAAWYSNLRRHLPMLTTDYGSESEFLNLNRERTLRATASLVVPKHNRQLKARLGYEYALRRYDYRRDVAAGMSVSMARSRSRQHTISASIEADFFVRQNLMLNAALTADENMVLASDLLTHGGFDRSRLELAAALTARWQPVSPVGLGVTLRQELAGSRLTPFTPALFADWLIHKPSNLTLKASATRNHRIPSLNDLYFLPGGNPNLKDEKGVNYDVGAACALPLSRQINMSASLSWFENYVNNWILWLPTPRGYFSPKNVKKVHSYGIEAKADMLWRPTDDWLLDLSGSLSWTPSINRGEPVSEADRSIGRQLPYQPRVSASVIGRLSWRRWAFTYKWNHYSRRYTMSTDSQSLTGYLPPYFMSNVSLENTLRLKPVELNLKFAVNNLFNEDYISVLSHPMPGINFQFFVTITY